MVDILVEDPVGAAEGEPLFRNVTHMDRDKYFEAVKARARSGRSLALTLGGIVAAVIGFLMHSYWIAALGAAVSVLAIVSPAAVGRRDFRRLCERHPGGEWEKTIRFYPDRIESDAGGGVITTAAYDDIKREYESERMYILDFGKACPAAAMEKDGFVKGSLEELKAFLIEARRARYAPEENVD